MESAIEQLSEACEGHQNHAGHELPATVVFRVDNREVFAHPGRYPVATVKKLAGVPLANDVDELVECVLKPLPDDGHVMIHGHEIFISHVKDGGSS
jgi:hypothetical protein